MSRNNYSKYLLEQINKIRTDPKSFIGVIEDAKDNIKEEENDKKIKEIEEEIKNRRKEKELKQMKIFENPKNKELLKLEIKVLRK